MVDETNNPDDSLPPLEGDDNLIKQIDELEELLAQKKAEAQAKRNILPKLNVGTDGIPVLVEAVTEEGLNLDGSPSSNENKKDDEFINDIIDKIDKEITEDLDELILMLKDSIIEEVKTRLLKELNLNKDNLPKK
jgi:hypothetical protein